jgi:cytochrome c553
MAVTEQCDKRQKTTTVNICFFKFGYNPVNSVKPPYASEETLRMKLSESFLPTAATALMIAAAFAVSTIAQAPQAPAAGTAGIPPAQARPNRAPTNLQVLPKDTTGQQLREIMAQWNSALGVQCNTCHTEDAKNLNPNGKPRLLCADDTKPEKTTTRTMYKLTGTINQSVGKIGSTGTQVTCGTCHRGHLTPEAFVAPPTANQRPTQAAPSAGAAPQPQS